MQHPSMPQPRRTILWDESTASYIWLDPTAKAAAAVTRAKRLQFHNTAVAYPTAAAFAELYSPDEYDASTRHNARCKATSKRKTGARQAARAGKVKPARLLDIMADALAALPCGAV